MTTSAEFTSVVPGASAEFDGIPTVAGNTASSAPESIVTIPEKAETINWGERGARARASLIAALNNRTKQPGLDQTAGITELPETSKESEPLCPELACDACGRDLKGMRAMEVLPCSVSVSVQTP